MVTVGKAQARLSISLYRSPGEDDSLRPDDLVELFRAEGIEPSVRRVNPINHEQWTLIVSLASPVLASVVGKIVEAWNKRHGQVSDNSALKIDFSNLKDNVEYRVTVTVKPSEGNRPKKGKRLKNNEH